MKYLLEFHPAQTLFIAVAIGFILGMFFIVWWDEQYQKEEQERRERHGNESKKLL